jgi:hypothetical protein
MFSECIEAATTVNYEISAMWETKPRTTPQKTSRFIIGSEQVTRPENPAS